MKLSRSFTRRGIAGGMSILVSHLCYCPLLLSSAHLHAVVGTEGDNEPLPPFHSRISLAKLFLETSQVLAALDILTVLEEEDDENIQVQYLLGLAWKTLFQSRKDGTSVLSQEQIQAGAPGTEENAEECGEEARDALLQALSVCLPLWKQ